MADPYVQLAKKTIEEYVKKGCWLSLPKDLPEKMLKKKAGVFVSIHQKIRDRKEPILRGCIGTILPTQENIAKEIVKNAVSAACHDHRFTPIKAEELPDLLIKVDILSEPEPITSLSALDPKKYGVIVKVQDGRTGLLLPDLPGIDNPHIQIAIACQKAGIRPDEEKFLYRFKVERHQEK